MFEVVSFSTAMFSKPDSSFIIFSFNNDLLLLINLNPYSWLKASKLPIPLIASSFQVVNSDNSNKLIYV